MSDVTQLTISGLGAHGDGVALQDDGTTVFVPGALPGEIWQLNEGSFRLLSSHPDRHGDLCAHYGRCGGCVAHQMPDAMYEAWKRGLVVAALSQHGIETDVVGPLVRLPLASRRRAVLTAERQGGKLILGFHGARSHDVEPITDCAVLRPEITTAFGALTALARIMLGGADRGRFAVLVTDSGLDITLIEPTVELGAVARGGIAELARAARFARVSCGHTPIVTLTPPHLIVDGVAVVPPPGAFVQAVGQAERQMADHVVAGVGRAKRVLDLFAGTGAFSLPLGRKARVLAMDSDKEALAALALAVRGATGLKPIETRVRDLFREPLSPKELSDFDAVVFDPPRAGAKSQAERLARSKVGRIVAVSCNPATLGRDLAMLIGGGYRLLSVTPIDQFVLSAHVEAVAVLERGK